MKNTSYIVLGIHFNIFNKELDNLQNLKTELPYHVTLLLMPVPGTEFFDKFILELKEYLKDVSQITIKINKNSFKKKNDCFFVDLKSEYLAKIHDNILKLAEKYRFGVIRNKDFERLENGCFNEQEEENLAEYGFAFSGSLYNPHISVKTDNISEVFETKLELKNIEIMLHHEDVSKNIIYKRGKIELN